MSCTCMRVPTRDFQNRMIYVPVPPQVMYESRRWSLVDFNLSMTARYITRAYCIRLSAPVRTSFMQAPLGPKHWARHCPMRRYVGEK